MPEAVIRAEHAADAIRALNDITLARQLGTALRGAANRLSHLGVRDA